MSAGTLLLVEDDPAFAQALARALAARGYDVRCAVSGEEATSLAAAACFSHAVIDLKLASGSGLPCVAHLHAADPTTRIVVLTGFASIATAVEAVKLGACHYLAKPANADDVIAGFGRGAGDPLTAIDGRPSSFKTLEWERINETLADAGFNISEAARRLGMHRRTLARKLAKRRVS